MLDTVNTPTKVQLPGLNCGLCGFRRCEELEARLTERPEWIKRCIYLSSECMNVSAESTPPPVKPAPVVTQSIAAACSPCASEPVSIGSRRPKWQDHLGRDFDFYLEKFPEEPGPREIIIPHNPMLTRELEIQPGDVLIGRPLGMSCGCPITHCGIATDVDRRTGVINWCITGPLNPRQSGFKDLGYYIAEAYDGLIQETRVEIKIGMRYFFQPHMCMLQWRHSGLVNYINRTPQGMQVHIEGLWIG
jgi:uncharacterized Fe-S cluster-containing protein